MDVVSGTDTSASRGRGAGSRGDPPADAARRRRADPDAIFRALARELLASPGAEEVHIHHLARNGAAEDLVDVYLFEAEGRVSYLLRAPSARRA